MPSRRWPIWLAGSLLASGLLIGCGGSDSNDTPSPAPTVTPVFNQEGLTGSVITRLYQHDDTLYATSKQGLFSKSLGQNDWQSIGLAEYEVLDIVFVDDDHWLVSVMAEVTIPGEGEDDPQTVFEGRLLETVNEGANWDTIDTDFGGEEAEAMYAMHWDAANTTLYATGLDVLAMSSDLGRTWTTLAGDWQSFGQPKRVMSHHPTRDEIWYGGQNAIEQMVLRRHDLSDNSEDNFPDLMPSPSVIYGIYFDAAAPDRILASGEGGIVESRDNGATWNNLLGDVNHRFYFQLAFDPQDTQTLYTAGWTKNFDTPQPLILEWSEDGGSTWKTHEYEDNTLMGGTRSILAVEEDNQTVLYLGLYGGGIMKVHFETEDTTND